MHQLLVEIGAQAGQFILIAQLSRGDDFVKLGRPALIVELRRQIPHGAVGADGEHPLLAFVAGVAIGIHVRFGVHFLLLAVFGLALTFLGAGVHLGLAVAFFRLFLILIALAFLFVFGLVVRIGRVDLIRVGGQFQISQQFLGELRKAALIVERVRQRVEIFARFLFNPAADHVEPGLCGGRSCIACQPFAHEQTDSGRQRHFVCGLRAGNRV